MSFVFFFFFQAEDGIRDVAVTGVQTCALPISGVDVLLNGNFVGGVLLEDPANTDIQAFGVLPENDQADVFLGAAAKRRESLVKQLHGPRVDVEVQLESQAKQNIG